MAKGPRFGDIRACVFDAFGTLFDVNSAINRHADRLGPNPDAVADLWRRKQLEYAWLRALMDRHADFWQVTEDALDHTLETYGVDDPVLRHDLLEAYLRLDAFTEVTPVLTQLRKAGFETAVLSNATPHMLEAALINTDLTEFINHAWSIEEIGVYKPDPGVYRIPIERLHLEPTQILFASANPWDVAGASSVGLFAVWINRYAAKRDRLPNRPDAEITSLTELPRLLGL